MVAAIGLVIGAVVAFFAAVANAIKALWPKKIKRGWSGIMYRRGEVKLDKNTKLPPAARNGIDNARSYARRMPPCVWPIDDPVEVLNEQQTSLIDDVKVDIWETREPGKPAVQVQYELVKTKILWHVLEAEEHGINYPARAIIRGQSGLEGLVTTIVFDAYRKVCMNKGLTLEMVGSSTYFFDEMSPMCAKGLLFFGVVLDAVVMAVPARVPVQVFVDNGKTQMHNGHTMPAAEAAGIDIGVGVMR